MFMDYQLDILQMVFNAGIIVKLVLLLLLFFSVTSWAIIFIKYRYLRRALGDSFDFTAFFWKKRDFSEAFAKSKQLRASPVANVFRAGYMEFKRMKAPDAQKKDAESGQNGFDAPAITSIERAMQRCISAELAKMQQLVPFLATTGNTT